MSYSLLDNIVKLEFDNRTSYSMHALSLKQQSLKKETVAIQLLFDNTTIRGPSCAYTTASARAEWRWKVTMWNSRQNSSWRYLLSSRIAAYIVPLHFVGWLGDEESLSVGRYLGAARIDGDLRVEPVFWFQFDGEQEQFQFCEAQSIRQISWL